MKLSSNFKSWNCHSICQWFLVLEISNITKNICVNVVGPMSYRIPQNPIWHTWYASLSANGVYTCLENIGVQKDFDYRSSQVHSIIRNKIWIYEIARRNKTFRYEIYYISSFLINKFSSCCLFFQCSFV